MNNDNSQDTGEVTVIAFSTLIFFIGKALYELLRPLVEGLFQIVSYISADLYAKLTHKPGHNTSNDNKYDGWHMWKKP